MEKRRDDVTAQSVATADPSGSRVPMHDDDVLERVNDWICHRAFSGPEALLYERFVASAVADIVGRNALDTVHGPRVLDAGCGGGLLAAHLRRCRGVVEIVAVDASPSQARRAQGVLGDIAQLPFADASFDAVVSSCAIKHVPDMTAGIGELLRVARPGSSVTIVEIDGAAPREHVRAWAGHLAVPRPIQAAYVPFFVRTVVDVAPTLEELVSHARAAGATVTDARTIDGLPYNVVAAFCGTSTALMDGGDLPQNDPGP
jgi:SAM-dependent methyltransferase